MIENGRKDGTILTACMLLLAMGVLMVYSATSVMSMRQGGSDYTFLVRHVFSVGLGLISMLALAHIDHRRLGGAAIPLLVVSLLLLLAVFIPGIGVRANGATRWIRLWPSTFQPSELAKLGLVVFLADWFSRPLPAHKEMNTATALRAKIENPVTGIVIPLAAMGILQLPVIFQPDFGAFSCMGAITLGFLFVAGVRLRYFYWLSPVALGVIVYLVSAPYRMKRITSFLDPWKDSAGSGYQLVQSLLAFGNGGFMGAGLGDGQQKLYYLPEPHTDFIFSMIAEELGLLGVLFVVGLFLVLMHRGMRLASVAEDSFGRYLAFGITFMLVLQALLNFAVVTGMLPTKGLPLPFVSYGGSSLLVSLGAAGILLSISRSCPDPRAIRPEDVWTAPKSREKAIEKNRRRTAGFAGGLTRVLGR